MDTGKDKTIILIAEDDAGHAFLIRKNLARYGIDHQVKHFADGQELLDFFFAGEPGDGRDTYDTGASYVLLLDIRMPKLDGIHVLRSLKARDDLKDIPVIMVTTTQDPKDVENSYNAGCSDYITKPIDYTKLIKALKATGLF